MISMVGGRDIGISTNEIFLNVIDVEIAVYMKLSPYFCEINSFYAIIHR